MKTSILRPQCTYYLDPASIEGTWKAQPVDCFWVEASILEVYCLIFKDEFIPYEKQVLRLFCRSDDEPNFYFWVAKDLSRIWQSFGAFPYSGMNDEKHTYIYFEPIEIHSLEELKDINPRKNDA